MHTHMSICSRSYIFDVSVGPRLLSYHVRATALSRVSETARTSSTEENDNSWMWRIAASSPLAFENVRGHPSQQRQFLGWWFENGGSWMWRFAASSPLAFVNVRGHLSQWRQFLRWCRTDGRDHGQSTQLVPRVSVMRGCTPLNVRSKIGHGLSPRDGFHPAACAR